MNSAAKHPRQKISTTVSPATLSYFEERIAQGEAHTLAEAIDLLVERLQALESRERLERDTAAYFERLSSPAVEEESSLSAALSGATRGLDIDREP